MSSHFFRYLFIQNCTLEFSLPPSKPFFVILLRKHLTVGAQYNESLDSAHFPEALEKLTLGVVGQLVDMKKTDGWVKKTDIMEGELSSQKIDDSERGERGVFFLEENGKMHGLKRKRSTMLVKSPWVLSPCQRKCQYDGCLPWIFLTLIPWDLLVQLIGKRFRPLEKQS